MDRRSLELLVIIKNEQIEALREERERVQTRLDELEGSIENTYSEVDDLTEMLEGLEGSEVLAYATKYIDFMFNEKLNMAVGVGMCSDSTITITIFRQAKVIAEVNINDFPKEDYLFEKLQTLVIEEIIPDLVEF